MADNSMRTAISFIPGVKCDAAAEMTKILKEKKKPETSELPEQDLRRRVL